MACSTPPMYCLTGMKWTAAAGIERDDPPPTGSQNLRKYHDESTNVSIVSVSRLGRTTTRRTRRELESRMAREGGLSARAGTPHRRERQRELVLRDAHDSASTAIDDRYRATPVALPGDEPVVQAGTCGSRDLSLALRTTPMARRFASVTETRPRTRIDLHSFSGPRLTRRTRREAGRSARTEGRTPLRTPSRVRPRPGTAMIAPVPYRMIT